MKALKPASNKEESKRKQKTKATSAKRPAATSTFKSTNIEGAKKLPTPPKKGGERITPVKLYIFGGKEERAKGPRKSRKEGRQVCVPGSLWKCWCCLAHEFTHAAVARAVQSTKAVGGLSVGLQ